MKTLQNAWGWYSSARNNLRRMQRLGSRHWDALARQDVSLWKDEWFKEVDAVQLERETAEALVPLNDLGVLVLFSVFEATVRDHLQATIEPLTASLGHPILRNAAEDVLEGIRQGSFANRVLSPLQEEGRISPQLSSKIKQVRDYRNWIAHGRREPRPKGTINLTPEEAYDRLQEFLDALAIVVESETPPALETEAPPEAELGEREP